MEVDLVLITISQIEWMVHNYVQFHSTCTSTSHFPAAKQVQIIEEASPEGETGALCATGTSYPSFRFAS